MRTMVQEKPVLITSMASRAQIRVCSEKGQALAGFVTNEFLNLTVSFRDVVEMLAILEQTFDFLSFPQTTLSYRSFRPASRRGKGRRPRKAGVRLMEKNPKEPERGEKATFLVHVQFRQHATWQGNITWVEKGVTQQFRSALEMLRLMNEAVEGEDSAQVRFEDGKPFIE